VPLEHLQQEKLPAVSGSSGHLVIEHIASGEEEKPRWPGKILMETELDYLEAMKQYAQLTRDRLVRQKNTSILPESEPTNWRKTWEVRAERHQVLQKRRQEDADWRDERKIHHQVTVAYRALSRRKRKEQAGEWESQKSRWAQKEAGRQEVLANRNQENQKWHQNASILRTGEEGNMRLWIAVLVVVDNCTRQCLGLPIFATGAKVTAQEVVTALSILLPKELAFLISDQGTHFRSKVLAQLALDADFIQIPIYRHRPQSNGFAERFVLTIKKWLKTQVWNGPEELGSLLQEFLPMYNDRPHQGLLIPGLSPDEFAKRIWLY
jgi:transposase InsO family protein